MTSAKPAARCQLLVNDLMLLTPPMSVKPASLFVIDDLGGRDQRTGTNHNRCPALVTERVVTFFAEDEASHPRRAPSLRCVLAETRSRTVRSDCLSRRCYRSCPESWHLARIAPMSRGFPTSWCDSNKLVGRSRGNRQRSGAVPFGETSGSNTN